MDETVIAAETPAEKTYFESKGTAETPADQQVETPADGQGEVDQAPKLVPHAALHEERVQRQRVTQELAKEREERAKLTGRYEVLERLARGEQRQVEQPKIPGKDEDIVGYLEGNQAVTRKDLDELKAWRQQQDQQGQQQQAMQGFRGAVAQHEETFRATSPDYDDATQFLRASRDEELQDMGYADPGLRRQIIDGEAIALADQAMRNNSSPAEGFYKMAVRRGYKKAAPVDPAARATTIRQGQKAGQSLAGAGGGGAAKGMSPEAILAMSDEEFDKLSPKDWEKAFGVARR